MTCNGIKQSHVFQSNVKLYGNACENRSLLLGKLSHKAIFIHVRWEKKSGIVVRINWKKKEEQKSTNIYEKKRNPLCNVGPEKKRQNETTFSKKKIVNSMFCVYVVHVIGLPVHSYNDRTLYTYKYTNNIDGSRWALLSNRSRHSRDRTTCNLKTKHQNTVVLKQQHFDSRIEREKKWAVVMLTFNIVCALKTIAWFNECMNKWLLLTNTMQ